MQVRYLGNKTKLIPFIMGAVNRVQATPGVACDPFAGTASVSAELKRAGWQVFSGDLMATSYALQVARVELDHVPGFPASLSSNGSADRRNGRTETSYQELLRRLSGVAADGFLSTHYTLGGPEGRAHERMYFSRENGRRIDGIRTAIRDWMRRFGIDAQSAQLLIATLIEAADRVANTTGVYASFVKTLQPNALRDLELRAITPTPRVGGAGACKAFRGPATRLLETAGSIDLLYLDPPYNGRQYPAYYHIPEIIARGWWPPPEIRGKTGLIPDGQMRSEWCRKDGAAPALQKALEAADARHVLFSYNDEGLLARTQIEEKLRDRGLPDSYRFFDQPYRRYRSDADGPGRSYRRNSVTEQLHYIECA